MSNSHRRFILAVTLIAGFAPAAWAISNTVNRLVNAQFTTNVNGWSPAGATPVWDTRDDDGSLDSGSLRNETPPGVVGTEGLGSAQCVPARGGMQIALGGRVMIPSGQTRNPIVGIGVRFHDASQACFGSLGLDFEFVGLIQADSDPLDTWTVLGADVTAPPGTDKMTVFLHISAGAGTGSAVGLYDTLYVVTNRAPENDLNNDALNDLLWRRPATGKNIWWSMDGASRASYGSLMDVPGLDWILVGNGYFNTGFDPDLVWRNTSTGQNIVWTMQETTRTGYVSLLSVPPPWEIVALESFDADDDADIVWRNPSTGQNVLWIMNGFSRISYTALPNVVGPEWTIAGSGDFNGDRKADLVWRNSVSGQNVIWFMNGATRLAYATTLAVPGWYWRIVAVTDLNGDGRADLVWRNSNNGQNVVWYMDGATRTSYASLMTVSDGSWMIQGPR